jgi:hypothetical protein
LVLENFDLAPEPGERALNTMPIVEAVHLEHAFVIACACLPANWCDRVYPKRSTAFRADERRGQ